MADGIVRFINDMNKNYPDEFSVKTIGFVYENTEYGQTQVEGVKANLTDNLEVVYEESYPPGLTDASALTTGLMQANVDYVIPIATVQDAKTILNSFRSMDFYPLIQGGGAGFLMPTFAAELGESVNGIISSGMANWDIKWIQENEILQQFVDAYEVEVGEWPVEHAVANMNIVYLIWQALEQSPGYDKDNLLDTLRDLEIVNMMPGGITQFDDVTGANSASDMIVMQWQKDPKDGVYKTFTIWPERDALATYQAPGTT